MLTAVRAVLGLALAVSASTAQAAAGVDVVGWMERDGAKRELVLSFTPRGGTKLVADPGITLEPLPGRIGPTFEHVEPGRAYFEAPLSLRVPIDATPGEQIGTRVNYAYCIVEHQCLFGETVIELIVPPS
jgi:hypothetical protein